MISPEPEDLSLDGKWTAIGLLAVAEVLVLALWLSASAVIPALRAEFGISDISASLLTSSVVLGFVAGTLASAFLGLADRIDPRRFFMVSAFIGAGANGAILLVEPTSFTVPLLRFVVGATMAGVYPVGMKMVATWARGDTGLLLGLLVGAVALGSGSPHLIDALGGLDWRFTIAAASVFAAAAAVLVNFVRLGPNQTEGAKFEAKMVLRAWTNKPLRLANLGYFGHMWELYGMWAWIGLFLGASFAVNPSGENAGVLARIVTFAVIGAGALGSLIGGYLADRIGRTTLTMAAMAISGACALVMGFLFGASPVWIVLLGLVWGVAIIADSAQFSASIIELSDLGITGTMLTVQTSIGFLLTIFTIHLIPPTARSISATGVLNPSWPHHFISRSGLVKALNTSAGFA
jgi:MFS family permease